MAATGLHAAAQTMLEIILKIKAAGQTLQRDLRSSAIENIGYDPNSELMKIRFVGKSGFPTYEYPYVPNDEVAKFIGSRSKGRHYHAHIKIQYGEGGYP